MNEHLTQQEWMEFLYGEMDRSSSQAVERHLAGCADCARKREALAGTAESLDAWTVNLPERHKLSRRWAPALKWAAAAGVLVTTAFATGRLSRPEIDVARLQEQIAKPIQEKVEQQVNARLEAQLGAMREEAGKAMAAAMAANKQQIETFARTVANLREQDQQTIIASLKKLEAHQSAEYLKLRQSLETVAVLTDQSLKEAQRKLVQLAAYTTPQIPTN